jgi:hypothetical protein
MAVIPDDLKDLPQDLATRVWRKRIQNSGWKSRNPEKMKEIQKNGYRKLRKQVMDAYGAKCKCCGEEHDEFLTIDHIGGDGAKHRKETNNEVYAWLRRNGYPEGFQVLCMNCNFSIGMRGYCPHNKTLGQLVFPESDEGEWL